MKTAEPKPATGSRSGAGKPFFGGAGGAVAEGEQRKEFFNAGGAGRKGVQAKLTVGDPGDKYERQADTTADKVVMKMAENKAPEKRGVEGRGPEQRGPAKPMAPAADGQAVKSKAPPVQLKCAQCEMKERKMKEEDDKAPEQRMVQRKPIFDSNAEPPPADDKHKIQRCAACEGKEMVRKSGESGGGPTASTGGSTATSPDLEARLNSTKGGGQPLPDGTRQEMESSMGADFSGVRVHNDSGAAQMNKDLSARAFTHGSDIYFNSGQYKPDSKEGQHLLAHELTHTVQQGAAPGKQAEAQSPTVQRSVWGKIKGAASWVGNQVEDLAGDVVDLAESVGSEVASIAGTIADGVVSAAEWVKDRVEDFADLVAEGFMAALNFVKDLIHKIWDQLVGFWDNLKEVAKQVAQSVVDKFNDVVQFFQDPLEFFTDALINLDPEEINNTWQSFVYFVNMFWSGFKSMATGVLDTVIGLFEGIGSFVEDCFNAVESILDSRPFGWLPRGFQDEIRKLYAGFKAVWDGIKAAFRAVRDGIRIARDGFFALGDGFIQALKDIPIKEIVEALRKFGFFIKKVREIFENPEPYIDMAVTWIVEHVRSAPDKFEAIIDERIAENKAKKDAGKKGRKGGWSGLSDEDVALGVGKACIQKWRQMDLFTMIKKMVRSMIIPRDTISAIGEAWDEMGRDILKLIQSFKEVDSLHKLWTNILKLADVVVIIHRFINTVLGLLFLYFAVIVVILGTAAGAILFGPPGAGAGFFAGLELVALTGNFLLVSFLFAEGEHIAANYLLLRTGDTDDNEKDDEFNAIADSIIGLAVAGLLAILSAIAASIARGLLMAASKIFTSIRDFVGDTGKGVKGGKGGKGAKGAGDEHGPVPEEKANTEDEPGGKEEEELPDSEVDEKSDPNKVEKGEAKLERPLVNVEEGKGKMAMDVDGECEVCASPCWKLRKKYGNRITKAIGEMIENVEKKRISNRAKLVKLRRIEKELRKTLDHLDEKGKLKPNLKKFAMGGEFKGYFGASDANGRLIRVWTEDLQLSEYDRVSHRKGTPGKRSGDQAGHLFGDRFGGSRELDNLVSQSSDVNLSEFKVMENEWAKAIERGETVKVDIEVEYNGNSKRPARFKGKYKIGKKNWVPIDLDN